LNLALQETGAAKLAQSKLQENMKKLQVSLMIKNNEFPIF